MTEKKIYELVTSSNNRYVAGICKNNMVHNMHEMKIWDGKSMIEIAVMHVCVDLGGLRYAISSDGKYVATAQYGEYEAGNIYIYNVQSGKNVFKNQSLRRIQWLTFADNKTLMIGTENNGIFVFDIISGACENKIEGKKVYYNKFGDSILLLHENKIKYENIIYKSSTFAYLCVTGTSKGILVSEANGGLHYYDHKGNLYWKTDCLDLGHFISVYYNEKMNIIYGILLNPRKKGDGRMHLIILGELLGDVVAIHEIETANYVFVENSELLSLVNGNGSIYIPHDDCLEKNFFNTSD